MTEVECPYCGNEFEDENFEQDYLSDIETEGQYIGKDLEKALAAIGGCDEL